MITFIVTVGVMLALYPLATRVGLVDHPGGRKSHEGVVPLIGGIAIFAGLIVGGFLLGSTTGAFFSGLVAGSLLIIIGVVDDAVSLPPATRVITQLAVLLIMIFGAELRLADIGDPFGSGVISMGPFSVIFTVVVGLTMINAYNLIDGLDGLAGSMAVIALLSVAVVAGTDNWFGAAALVAVMAICGFLVFNFPVRWNRSVRSFMGDAGSTLLGFTIVWLTLGITQGEGRVISPVHCLWFAAIPIFDCLTCFVRRSSKRKSPFTPGRDHFHHSLRRGGFSATQTVRILATYQLLFAIIGVGGHFAGVPDVVMFIGWSIVGLTQRVQIQRIAKLHRLRLWSQIRLRRLANLNETART
jgi:UDP-GlcNAc:undecaprenyl-phosphate GlcNAc-1-phosphate transferase